MTEELIEGPTEETGAVQGGRRKRLLLTGAAAGLAALVAVPAIAVAASNRPDEAAIAAGNSPDEADLLACEAAILSYAPIADAGREDMDSVGAALAADDMDSLGLYTDKMADHEQAAEDFDTSACDAAAPSFAPAVDAAAEMFHYFSLGLHAADAGDWETAASFKDEVTRYAADAERLGGDAADEFNHNVDALGL